MAGDEEREPRKLPPLKSWDVESRDLPPLAPILVGDNERDALLRRGHKMLITGPSKAGKSWLAIELACALARGGSWLGYSCTPGLVVYVNLEVDPSSRAHRTERVWSALYGDCATGRERLLNLDLRGEHWPLSELCPALVFRTAEEAERRGVQPRGLISAFIIDPFYKTFDGDENAAGDTAGAMEHLDALANNTGASVVFVHHHAKGAAGGKRAIDRGSGSGVFGRDPDAILDVSPIEIDEEGLARLRDNHPGAGDVTPWRVSPTLREFRSPGPIDVLWSFPTHIMAIPADGLASRDIAGANPMAEQNKRSTERKWRSKNEAMGKALAKCEAEGEWPTQAAVFARMDWGGLDKVTLSTFKSWLKSPSCEYETERVPTGGGEQWAVVPRSAER